MTSQLLRRVKRLEEQSKANQPICYRIGLLKRLPEGFAGKRHIVITRREPVFRGVEGCEFEERAGPDPYGAEDDVLRIYLSPTDIRL